MVNWQLGNLKITFLPVVRSSCSASASGALTPTPDSNYLGGGGYYHLPYRSTVSASTSPCCYGGMSPNYSNRTPYTSSGAYLGWRKHCAPTGSYKSPAERLAEGLRASRTSIESTESNVSNMSSTGSVGSRAMRWVLFVYEKKKCLKIHANNGRDSLIHL